MEWIYKYLQVLWMICLDTAPFLMLGMIMGGVLKALIPQAWLMKAMGGRGVHKIVAASLLGAPLPLCSCGVLPVAMTLRRQGASRATTSSFLIATPETGVDSVAVSYALLGPFFAIVRPICAIFGAIFAGLLVELFGPPELTPSQRTDSNKANDQASDDQLIGTPAVSSGKTSLENEKETPKSCCGGSGSTVSETPPKKTCACGSGCSCGSQTVPGETKSCGCDAASKEDCTADTATMKTCCCNNGGKSQITKPDQEKQASSCCGTATATAQQVEKSSCGCSTKTRPAKTEKAVSGSDGVAGCGCGCSSNPSSVVKPNTASCCSSEAAVASGCGCGCGPEPKALQPQGVFARLKEGMHYSFTNLLDHMSSWLVIGLLAAAAIAAFVPGDFLTNISNFGYGIPLMIAMIIIGVPMYICATSSTPIAAALIAAGISPGAAIVFLSAGPATNIAGLAIVRNEIGTRATVLYLIGGVASTLIAGITTDRILHFFPALHNGIKISNEGYQHWHLTGWMEWVAVASVIILIICMIKPLRRSLGKFPALLKPSPS